MADRPRAPSVAARHLSDPGGSTVATIVVGIEDSLRGQDAVALAGDLARASGAEVLAVCAYPFDDAARRALQPRHARPAARGGRGRRSSGSASR